MRNTCVEYAKCRDRILDTGSGPRLTSRSGVGRIKRAELPSLLENICAHNINLRSMRVELLDEKGNCKFYTNCAVCVSLRSFSGFFLRLAAESVQKQTLFRCKPQLPHGLQKRAICRKCSAP